MQQRFTLFFLLTLQTLSGMSFPGITIQRVLPDQALLNVLVTLKNRPGIADLNDVRRSFVARMMSCEGSRYYLFKTDGDIEELMATVEKGYGSNLEWFYYHKNRYAQPHPPTKDWLDFIAHDKAIRKSPEEPETKRTIAFLQKGDFIYTYQPIKIFKSSLALE